MDDTKRWATMPRIEGWYWYSEDLSRPDNATLERVHCDSTGRVYTSANWWGEGPPISSIQGYWLRIEDHRVTAAFPDET